MPAKMSAEQLIESARLRVRNNSEVDPATGCWEWLRSKSRDGYGWTSIGNRTKQAHRLAYEVFAGEIADGMQLDHLCRNPGCVNPDHLEPVTHRENQLRGNTFTADHNSKDSCPRCGGEYEPKWNATHGRWARFCRPCANSVRNARLRRQRADARRAA